MNALNMIITNMNSMENIESAVQDAANNASSDKFRLLLKAQDNPEAGNADSKNIKDMLMLHMLTKNENGDVVNLKAKIAGVGSEEENEDSMCGDSNLQELVDGIVGILEGFGLLDYDMEEGSLDKLSESISQYISMGELNEDVNQGLSQLIARMPNINQNETLKAEIGPMIQEVVEKYQCSFENTNNMGVDKADLSNEGDDTSDKIKIMLKLAVSNSNKTQNNQIKQMGKENSLDNQDKKTNAENLNGKTQVFGVGNAAENPNKIENVSKETLAGETEQVNKAMDDNVANIAEKITASQIEGKKEFDVTLKPDFLGKLSVKLIIEEDGIRAQIKAADQYVKGLITDQLPELSEQLKQKGVNMTNIEVVYDSPDFSSFEGQFQQHSNMSGHSFKSSRSFYSGEMEPIDSATYEAMLDYTDLTLKNSSVEFSA